MGVRRAAPLVVRPRRGLVGRLRARRRGAGVRGLLATLELAGWLIGGLLRAMVGLCIRVRLTRWLLRRLRWLGRLLLTSVRTNTLIRLDFPLQSQ